MQSHSSFIIINLFYSIT